MIVPPLQHSAGSVAGKQKDILAGNDTEAATSYIRGSNISLGDMYGGLYTVEQRGLEAGENLPASQLIQVAGPL